MCEIKAKRIASGADQLRAVAPPHRVAKLTAVYTIFSLVMLMMQVGKCAVGCTNTSTSTASVINSSGSGLGSSSHGAGIDAAATTTFVKSDDETTSSSCEGSDGGVAVTERTNASLAVESVDWLSATSVYNFSVKTMKGRVVPLEKYKGKVLLIVNVASKCSMADMNYRQLVRLSEKYYKQGLRILAFPCNQFRNLEPGTAEEIMAYVKGHNVKFDVFDKVEVNGQNASPLWRYLKLKLPGTLGHKYTIKWTFTKFIIDRNGIPVKRCAPMNNPAKLEPYVKKFIQQTRTVL